MHFIRVRNGVFFLCFLSSYKLFFRVTQFAHLLRMFLRSYTHFKNPPMRCNDISHVTSINQETFFNQSQFMVFLSIRFSVFLLCPCIVRNPVVFHFITCVSFLYRNYYSTTKKERAIPYVIAYFLLEDVNK